MIKASLPLGSRLVPSTQQPSFVPAALLAMGLHTVSSLTLEEVSAAMSKGESSCILASLAPRKRDVCAWFVWIVKPVAGFESI